MRIFSAWLQIGGCQRWAELWFLWVIKAAHPSFLKSLKLINFASYSKHKTANINSGHQGKEGGGVRLGKKYSLLKTSHMSSCGFKQRLGPRVSLGEMSLKMLFKALVFTKWLWEGLRSGPGSLTTERFRSEPIWSPVVPAWIEEVAAVGLFL